ncbi:MAG TPA: winged helix DNA-binding domain-containing protein [Jatrophihabitantaceae bacterium]|nr:winged helix DNA-binding domain-containing protein [Jatrophihabitantaceae bacterium]
MATSDPVLAERIARHGFATRPAADAVTAAAMVCGIQAQDPQASRLGVRARSTGVTEKDVLAAIEQRCVVRTWLMRNTIHLVPADDVRWMTALLGPMIRRRFEAVRWPELGLTPELLDRAAAVTPAILAGRALTRQEFAAQLGQHGVAIAQEGQASTHVLLYLSAVGLTCRGTDLGREATFVLIDDWIPDAAAGPRGDDALAELARRFFTGFSPATPADFTTWSGLPSSRAITLIRDELTAADVHGRAGYRLGIVEPQRGLRMLPAFDNYLVGYKERAALIADDRRAEVYVGGVIRPTVLLDGRVVGRWQLDRAKGRVQVLEFERLSRSARSAIDAEVADTGAFLDQELAID